MGGTRLDIKAAMVKDMYGVAFDAFAKEQPMCSTIYSMVYNNEGSGEKETQMLGADELIERDAENQHINFSSPVQGWVKYCKYRTFQKGLTLSDDEVDDNVKLGNILQKYAKTWAERDIQKRETVGATPFNAGGAVAGDTVFDGSHTDQTDPYPLKMYDDVCMFNLTGNTNEHKGGGTYYYSVASLDLTPTNFSTIYNLIHVTNAKDELDIIKNFPVDTLLTLSGSPHETAKRILESDQMAFGQLNDKNIYKNLVDPIAWRYLTDTGAFYVGKRGHEDFQFRERKRPQIRYFVDEHDLSHNASYKMRFGLWIKRRVWARGAGTS